MEKWHFDLTKALVFIIPLAVVSYFGWQLALTYVVGTYLGRLEYAIGVVKNIKYDYDNVIHELHELKETIDKH